MRNSFILLLAATSLACACANKDDLQYQEDIIVPTAARTERSADAGLLKKLFKHTAGHYGASRYYGDTFYGPQYEHNRYHGYGGSSRFGNSHNRYYKRSADEDDSPESTNKGERIERDAGHSKKYGKYGGYYGGSSRYYGTPIYGSRYNGYGPSRYGYSRNHYYKRSAEDLADDTLENADADDTLENADEDLERTEREAGHSKKYGNYGGGYYGGSSRYSGAPIYGSRYNGYRNYGYGPSRYGYNRYYKRSADEDVTDDTLDKRSTDEALERTEREAGHSKKYGGSYYGGGYYGNGLQYEESRRYSNFYGSRYAPARYYGYGNFGY